MSLPNSVYDLYRDRAVLWVEDELTREALTMLWGPTPGVAVAIAGSKDGVRALVSATPGHRAKKVFGLVDRDFDAPKSVGRIVQTARHEFENELLDFDVIADLSPTPVSAADVEAYAKAHAQGLVPWIACKNTLQVAKEQVRTAFPSDPPLTLSSLGAAADFVLSSVEWRRAPAAWGEWSERARVERELGEWEAMYTASLTTGRWVDSLPGKELFRALRGAAHLGLSAGSLPKASAAQKDLDLAKRICRAMIERDRVPTFVTELRLQLTR